MVKITKRGNSVGINVNPLWLGVLGWEVGTKVIIEVKGDEMIIKKAQVKED